MPNIIAIIPRSTLTQSDSISMGQIDLLKIHSYSIGPCATKNS